LSLVEELLLGREGGRRFQVTNVCATCSLTAILRGLKKKGIQQPTPIQIQGIPTM